MPFTKLFVPYETELMLNLSFRIFGLDGILKTVVGCATYVMLVPGKTFLCLLVMRYLSL